MQFSTLPSPWAFLLLSLSSGNPLSAAGSAWNNAAIVAQKLSHGQSGALNRTERFYKVDQMLHERRIVQIDVFLDELVGRGSLVVDFTQEENPHLQTSAGLVGIHRDCAASLAPTLAFHRPERSLLDRHLAG
jgi:hypothetical protein